jgi:fused signal recognition particle receptor
LLAIAQKLGIPVRFIGIGESAEDMHQFRAAEYADALFEPRDRDRQPQ